MEGRPSIARCKLSPMSMPHLPGLMGGAKPAAPASLADILSQLDEGQVADLVATAKAATAGADAPPSSEAAEGQPPEGSPAEEASESDEEAAAEGDDETDAAEPSEQDVEDVAAQGFEQICSWAESANSGIASQLEQVQQLQAAAEAAAEKGADPDSIEPLAEQAQELADQATEYLDECNAAADKQDAHGCATAALMLDRCAKVMAKIVEQAQAYAEPNATPEAGFYDEPAVKLWAERTAPKPGPMM